MWGEAMRRRATVFSLLAATIALSSCSSDASGSALKGWTKSSAPDCAGGPCAQYDRTSPDGSIFILPWGAPYDFPTDGKPVPLDRGDKAVLRCTSTCEVWLTIGETGFVVQGSEGVDADTLVAFAKVAPLPGL